MISLVNGNSLAIPLADGCVQCCVTSPPYWGLRDYGVGGQLGLESTPELFVEQMVLVFREVWRVLKDDGILWLNLGDSYAGSGGAGGDYKEGGLKSGQPKFDGTAKLVRSKRVARGKNSGRWGGGDTAIASLPAKNLVGVPWRVAFALQADGWYLRDEIVWAKPNPMPESVRDRCTKSHEKVFMLTKSSRYYFDQDAIREPYAASSLPRALRGVSSGNKNANGASGSTAHTFSKPRENARKEFEQAHAGGGSGLKGHSGYRNAEGRLLIHPKGANKKNVWTVPTRGYKGAHFATYPPALIEPMILAGSREGDVVFDPFVGSGTTLEVARKHGRSGVGLDLSLVYLREQARERLGLRAWDAWENPRRHTKKHEVDMSLPLFVEVV